jgi:hypothetical protein
LNGRSILQFAVSAFHFDPRSMTTSRDGVLK